MDVKLIGKVTDLLRGWPAGAIVIVVAVVAAIIAVPRPALLDEIPRPIPDRRVLNQISEADTARAAQFARQTPSYDVRALGEAMRRYGAADADGDAARTESALRAIAAVLPAAAAGGDEPLLQLRAYEMWLFLEQVKRFESTGEESTELRELGGGFAALVRRARWLAPGGNGQTLAVPHFVREALFRKRWNEITGLRRTPFAPHVHEVRALYAFLLAHPVLSVAAEKVVERVVRCRAADEYLLNKVRELGELDREYPADMARGILLLRLDRTRDAVEALAGYVERRPDGPYAMRARNALRAAQDRLMLLTTP